MNRLIVILVFLFSTSLFAEEAEQLTYSGRINDSSHVEFAFSWANFQKFEFNDFAFSLNVSYAFNDFIRASSDVMSLRLIKDGSDYRVGTFQNLVMAGAFAIAMGCGVGPGLDSTAAMGVAYPLIGLMTVLNPSMEFFFVRKYVPLSLEVGYNMDWFVFSPGQKFYFKFHSDLNVYLKISNIWIHGAGSLGYLVTDTYDSKHGFRPEFRLGIVF